MAKIKGIDIRRPVGRPTTEQRILEASLIATGDSLRKWQKSKNKIASGKSYNGYRVRLQKNTDRTVIVGLLSNKAKYLNAVLFGRRAGVAPTTADIERWMKIKPVIARNLKGQFKNRTETAYLIAQSIGQFGTRAPELSGSIINLMVVENSQAVIDRAIKGYTDEKLNEFMATTMGILGNRATTDFDINTSFEPLSIDNLL